MAKKSKKKAPAKPKVVKAPAKPVPEEAPPRVSIRRLPKSSIRKESVIMLSSAENTFASEPSLILNEPSISIIDLARPSTRMSNVDMTLEVTGLSDPRFSERPLGGDDTNLSLTNIVQTPGVHRERPKSSWVIRRTRSKSVLPPQPEPDSTERRTTQSGEFSMVTKRAKSARPAARVLASIDEDSSAMVTVSRRPKKNQAVEQPVPATPGPSKVTTRRRAAPAKKLPSEQIATEVEQPSQVSTRRRQNRKDPSPSNSSKSTTDDSNKSLENTVISTVSVRRRRPAPKTPPARMRTRSASRERQPEMLLTAPASTSRPKRAIKKVSKCPCCVNGESHAEPAVRGRSRTRTVSERPAAPTPPPSTGSRTRSKSVLRDSAVPKTPNATRSKSVPRDSAAHVPVYRQQPEKQVSNRAMVAATIAKEDDIYAFDSPGLLGKEAEPETGRKKKKGGGSTAKKKHRLVNVSGRGKRTTPAKKAQLTAIFGTDMKGICNVVKKIGGGPVRKAPTEVASAVQTSTIESAVLPLIQPAPVSRAASPVPSSHDPGDDDHHHFADDDHGPEPANDSVIIPPSPPPSPLRTTRPNPLIERVLQQQRPEPATPDRTAPPNVMLAFSPLGASSPWRVQDENQVLPKTFYFSRSKDLLPSYESDVVIRDENAEVPRPKTPVAEPEPVSGAKADAMFRGIQKSYEQLKVTSEMSNKLITAMRKYKSTVHNQSLTSMSASGELPEDERLIAKFREYEANMKKTYAKLKQWYERSQQQLTHSIKTIEQVSAVPKTLAQRQVLDNFRRDSKIFLTMINELESAMNDSNVENVSPPDKAPAFKDVVILTERNVANRNRSPLKTLEIANVPARFSPIKSPLVRASFSAFPRKSIVPEPAAEQPQQKDLFGFETEDDSEEANDNPPTSAATPIKITKKTLKERLESVRKMLPPRPPSRTERANPNALRREARIPKVFGSPRKPRSVQSVFASSTPLAQKRNRPQPNQLAEADVNLSAITDEPVEKETAEVAAPSPPVALFDDVVSTSMSAVNRTYSRIPRRNHKRKRNIYLADLGLSDDEEEEEHEDGDGEAAANELACGDDNDEVRKGAQAKKKRRVAPSKKKNPVEQTNEFKQFVSEFNSMCEEVDRYQLVIEKPAAVGVRQRV